MRNRPSDYLYRVLLLACVAVVALSILGCFSLGTPTPAGPLVVADTPTPVVIVVTATPIVAPPSPTGTAVAAPTASATPSATPTSPAPAATATATKPAVTAAPTATATTVPAKPTVPALPSPTPQCQPLPVGGFGKVWIENEAVRNYVGCPLKSETGVDFTAQRFEKGVILFTSPSAFYEKDTVLVLFRDDKTWSTVIVPSGAAPGTIGAPPAGMYAPTGRIGWAWQNAAAVRTRLGWAIEPEKAGTVAALTHAAWQSYSRGNLFWVKYNDPDDRWIYVVAAYRPYPPGGSRSDWLEYKDTWTATP